MLPQTQFLPDGPDVEGLDLQTSTRSLALQRTDQPLTAPHFERPLHARPPGMETAGANRVG